MEVSILGGAAICEGGCCGWGGTPGGRWLAYISGLVMLPGGRAMVCGPGGRTAIADRGPDWTGAWFDTLVMAGVTAEACVDGALPSIGCESSVLVSEPVEVADADLLMSWDLVSDFSCD